jgi:hypothetical protein
MSHGLPVSLGRRRKGGKTVDYGIYEAMVLLYRRTITLMEAVDEAIVTC